jgi:hypothetical protein
MARLSFSVDQKYLDNGVEYRLDRFLPENIWQVENTLTGEYTKQPLDELHEKYRTMQLTLIVDPAKENPIAERIGKVILPDRTLYSDKQLSRTQHYENFLSRLSNIYPFPRGRKKLQAEINSIAKDLGVKAPSAKTIERVRKVWLKCSENYHSLLPRFKAQGRRGRFTPAVEWLIDRCLQSTCLTMLRMKITDAWALLDQKVQAVNSGDQARIDKMFPPKEQAEAEFEQLKYQAPIQAPSLSALYRRIHQISYYKIVEAQFGKRYADKMFRTTYPGQMPARPLERVDGDETTTDLFVIDEIHHLWMGRAYATVLYEAYCHGISGFYLGFEPHSVLAYMRAIRHSILPKTYISTEYPVIKNRWEIHGVAELYNLDNAMAAHSGDFEDIADDLNTTILFDPPAIPWFKGLVERWFKAVNETLFHSQLGTTFSRMADIDGDYDPQKNAVIPYGLLMLMFHEYIVDIQLQSPNSGISDIPARRWANYVHEIPPPLPPSSADLDIILGRRLERNIWAYGIEIDGLFYQSDELGELRKRLSRVGNNHPTVKVNAPPGDLELIYVYDPDAQKHITVQSTNLEYTKGLSRYAHQVHCQYTKKYLDGATDVHSLTEAKVQIWQWGMEAARLNKSFARYFESHDRPNPAGALISLQMLTDMVDRMAGKPEPLRPMNPKTRTKKQVRLTDLPVDELPTYETSHDMPDLSGCNVGNSLSGSGESK